MAEGNLEKNTALLEESLNKLKIPYQKPENAQGLWFLNIKVAKNGPVVNLRLQILDRRNGEFSELTADMGEVPHNPKEQWAMFMRLLQLNYYDTSHGRFAIDEKRNEIIFTIMRETKILAAELSYFIDIVAYIYNEVRPRALGFVN